MKAENKRDQSKGRMLREGQMGVRARGLRRRSKRGILQSKKKVHRGEVPKLGR